MSESNAGISRRTLISGAAFGLVALGGAGGLAGCSGGGTAATISDKVAALPTYVPITKGPKPDLPGNDKVQPVYYAYPEEGELFRSVARDLTVGGTTTGFVVTYSAPPPAKNSFLDYIGEVTDTEYDLTFTAFANVPEPSTLSLLGGAALLAGAVGWRTRRRARARLAA